MAGISIEEEFGGLIVTLPQAFSRNVNHTLHPYHARITIQQSAEIH
jgi:hypothetical protein